MSVKVALVAGSVRASFTPELLVAAVDCRMSLEQSFAVEITTALLAQIAGVVEDGYVIPQSSFATEGQTATLQRAQTLLVHGENVALEIVLAVCEVGAVWTGEEATLRGGWCRCCLWQHGCRSGERRCGGNVTLKERVKLC